VYISEISERSGLSIHTLRYYEKAGLLNSIARDASGRRVFSRLDLEWLTWIQRLKSTGMPLKDIKRFAELRLLGDQSFPDRKIMLQEHAEQLRKDIRRRQEELAIVDYKIQAYQEKENEVLT
jgi:DNA-binding transcriptional MerR regulator